MFRACGIENGLSYTLHPADASYVYACASARFRERCIVSIDVPCMWHLYVHVWVRHSFVLGKTVNCSRSKSYLAAYCKRRCAQKRTTRSYCVVGEAASSPATFLFPTMYTPTINRGAGWLGLAMVGFLWCPWIKDSKMCLIHGTKMVFRGMKYSQLAACLPAAANYISSTPTTLTLMAED